MSAAFTPGPWDHDAHLIGCYIDTCKEWTHVASTGVIRTANGAEEEKANALLITAAPDMYDALFSIKAMLEGQHSAAAAALRATCEIALARAEGR